VLIATSSHHGCFTRRTRSKPANSYPAFGIRFRDSSRPISDRGAGRSDDKQRGGLQARLGIWDLGFGISYPP
jgi:hypothetical protein